MDCIFIHFLVGFLKPVILHNSINCKFSQTPISKSYDTIQIFWLHLQNS